MKKIYLIIAAMCICNILWGQGTATITPAMRNQTIDGLGTCLYDNVGVQSWFQNLYYDDAECSILRFDITPKFRSPYSNWTYNSPWFHNSPALPGPEGNNVRTYTGANDYTRTYAGRNAQIAVMGPDINANINLLDFTNVVPNSAGTMAGIGKVKAAQLGDFKLTASMWSPAPWVKISSGNVSGANSWPLPIAGVPYPFIWYDNFVGGRLDVSNTPLPVFFDGVQNTSALTQYARCLVAYLRGFQNRFNVKFYAISIQNELNFETFYNSAFYPLSSQYITAVVAARREMDKYPDLKDIKIMGPEDLLSGADYALWQYGGGASTVHKNLQYLQNIGLDTAATRAVDYFCIHGYAADGVGSAGADPVSWGRWANGWTSSPAPGIPATANGFRFYNKKSWMTETSGEDPAWLYPGSGFPSGGGFGIALNIHQAFTTGHESGYVYWQMADGDANSTGGALTGSSQQANAPKYNAFKHYSKYIRPGAVRINSTVTGTANISISTYIHDANLTYTIVLINSNNASRTVTINIPTSPFVMTTFTGRTSSNGSLWQASSHTVAGNQISVTLPAYGVMTLYGKGTNPLGTLNIAPSTGFTYPSSASTSTLTITGTAAWVINKTTSPWLTLSTTNGVGNRNVIFNATTNPGSMRIATVTVSGAGNNYIFNVTQAGAATANTYYISPTGNDTNDGLSPATAWNTISRVNTHAWSVGMQPGDRLLFEGNRTFSGSLYFQGNQPTVGRNIGNASNPIVISTYNTGIATILAGLNSGFYAYNAAGYSISGLIFKGAGPGINTVSGISFYNDQGSYLDYIYIHTISVSGFDAGLSIGEWAATTPYRGYSNITVTSSAFFDNYEAGITTWGRAKNSHTNLVVRNVFVYRNWGDPTKTANSGNGIVIGNVAGGLIEHSVAFDNGKNNLAISGGPCGIWCYESQNLTIQYCESYDNKSLGYDGCGFDIDGGSENCIIQYCYSHDNYGPGYLFAQYVGATTMQNNYIRYNISVNDGRQGSKGSIHIWGGNTFSNCHVYNNTVYTDNSTGKINGTMGIVKLNGTNYTGIKVRNNIFITSNGGFLIDDASNPATSVIHFQNNSYFAIDGNYRYIWGGNTYNSLSNWKSAASGQEAQGGTQLGLQGNPLLENMGISPTLNNTNLLATSLSGYRLRNNSPLINLGIDLRTATYGSLNVGNYDFYSGTIPQGVNFDIGCNERTPFLTALGANLTNVSATGGAFVITINSNVSWNIINPVAWITTSTTSGSNNNAIVTLNILPNTSATGRNTIISVTGSGLLSTINISQLGTVSHTLSYNPANQTFASGGGTNGGNIVSNTNWTVTSPVAWVSPTSFTGFGTGSLGFAALANTTVGARFAVVTITTGLIQAFVNITQSGVSNILTVNTNILNYSLSAATVTVSVTSNISWTATSSQAWLILAGGSGSGNGTFTAATSLNNSASNRVAQITISGGAINRIINVTQTGIRPLRIVSLGNSITQGNVVGGVINQWSYRFFLWEKLDSLNINVDMVGHIPYWFNENSGNMVTTPVSRYTARTFDRDHDAYYGITSNSHLYGDPSNGWTGSPLPSLANRAYTPDIALLHIGTNDNDANVSTTVSNINHTIDEFRKRNPNVVVLVAKLITGWKAINGQVDALVAAKTTAQSPVIAVDHATGFINDPGAAGTMTFDWVHPNTVGSVFMAKRWFDPIIIHHIDPIAPASPATISATNLTSSASRLNWAISTDNIGIKGYRIFVNGSYSGSTTGAVFTVSGLAQNTNYPITVVAIDFKNNVSAPAITNIFIPSGSYLIASLSALTYASTGGLQNVSVSSNVSWTVTDNAPWITTSLSTGTGNALLGITASANTTAGIRTAQVSIAGASLIQIVNITQAGFVCTSPGLNPASVTHITNCGLTNGSIAINATGGNPPLEYSLNGTAWQTSNIFNALAANTYTPRVRNQSSVSCSATGTDIVITTPGAPAITNSLIQHVSNCGLINGAITILGTGGTGPLEYSLNGTAWQTSNVFNALAANTYTPRVRNQSSVSCSATGTNVVITTPGVPAITNSLIQHATNCGLINGAITILGTGGTGLLEYSLNGTTWQTSNAFNALAANTYTPRVRNQSSVSCSATGTNVVITTPSTPTLTGTSKTDVSNCGLSNGSISISGSGSLGTLQYSIITGVWGAANTFGGLNAGSYTPAVRYTAYISCSVSGTLVTLNAPNTPTFSSVFRSHITNCGLTNGGITLTGTGGTAPYEYSFNGGSTWSSAVASNNLSANNYNIAIRNSGSPTCSFTGTALITIPSAPAITNSLIQQITNCGLTNGAITILGTGGTGTLEYSLNVTAWQTSNVFNALVANTYIPRVRNQGSVSCSATGTNVVITTPSTPSINSFTKTDVTNCSSPNGTITISGTGGTGTQEYSINGSTWQIGNIFTNLSAGSYTPYIRNQGSISCSISGTLITIAACAGGGIPVSGITIMGAGGVATLTTLGATLQFSAITSPANATVNTFIGWATSNASIASISSSGLLTAMANGIVTVTGTAGTVTSSLIITVNQPPVSTTPGVTLTFTGATTLTFGGQGGLQSFTLSGTGSWSIATSHANIMVSPALGSGAANINVSLSGNNSSSAFTGAITITGGGLTQVINIQQDVDAVVCPMWIFGNASPLTLDAAGGVSVFTVTAVANYDIDFTKNADWLTIVQLSKTVAANRCDHNYVFRFSISQNLPKTGSNIVTVNGVASQYITILGVNMLNKISQNLDNNIIIYPNPVKRGEILYFNKEVTGELYNVIGNKVLDIENSMSIATQDVVQGIYFLKTNKGYIYKIAVE
ncbi:MAG: BACON domain-containing carbohydrate-binding protein [Cytophagales bacterium]|nr:BACON domain-containing carbohydrate-binding protein [Cytophagales bacterium]